MKTLSLLALFAPGLAWAGGTAAVVPLIPKGVDAKVSTNVTGLLTMEMDFSGAYDRVNELSEVPSALNASSCMTSTTCLGGVAKTLGADTLLVGTVAPGGAGYQIYLVLYDRTKNTIVRKKTFDVPADPGSLSNQANSIVKEMLTGQSAEQAKAEDTVVAPVNLTDEEDEFSFDEPSAAKPTTRFQPTTAPKTLSDLDDGEEIDFDEDPEVAAAREAAAERAEAEAAAKARAEADAKRLAAEEEAARVKAAQIKAEAAAKAKAEAAAKAKADAEAAAAAKAKADADAKARAAEQARLAALAAEEEEEEPAPAEEEDLDAMLASFSFGSSAGKIAVQDDDAPAPTTSRSTTSSSSSTSRTSTPTPSKSTFEEDDEELLGSVVDEEEEDLEPLDLDADEPVRTTSSRSSSSSSSRTTTTSSRPSSTSSSSRTTSSRSVDLDEDRARVSSEGESAVSLAGRVGYSRYYDFNFVTYGGELGIPVGETFQINIGLEGFSTQRHFTEEEILAISQATGTPPAEVDPSPWNTILPFNVGMVYKNAARDVRPYVGLDLTLTPYTENFDLAIGGRARAGVDFMVVDTFGFNLNFAAGIMSGDKLELTDESVKNAGLIPQFSGGTVLLF